MSSTPIDPYLFFPNEILFFFYKSLLFRQDFFLLCFDFTVRAATITMLCVSPFVFHLINYCRGVINPVPVAVLPESNDKRMYVINSVIWMTNCRLLFVCFGMDMEDISDFLVMFMRRYHTLTHIYQRQLKIAKSTWFDKGIGRCLRFGELWIYTNSVEIISDRCEFDWKRNRNRIACNKQMASMKLRMNILLFIFMMWRLLIRSAVKFTVFICK